MVSPRALTLLAVLLGLLFVSGPAFAGGKLELTENELDSVTAAGITGVISFFNDPNTPIGVSSFTIKPPLTGQITLFNGPTSFTFSTGPRFESNGSIGSGQLLFTQPHIPSSSTGAISFSFALHWHGLNTTNP